MVFLNIKKKINKIRETLRFENTWHPKEVIFTLQEAIQQWNILADSLFLNLTESKTIYKLLQ